MMCLYSEQPRGIDALYNGYGSSDKLEKRLSDLQPQERNSVMSPTSKLEQAEVPQQFAAARRSNRSQNSLRAIAAPYTSVATSSDAAMRSPTPTTTSATPSMITMAQEMIAEIATSTDVPEQVARVAGLWNKTIRTRSQTHTLEEAEELPSLRAKLSSVECNARDLHMMAEHEHHIAQEVVREGRQFFAFIEDRARGFQSRRFLEAATAREKCDYELSLYRKADARRQQEHFSQLQQTFEDFQ
eukprot:2544113-Amphidinium_carterae.2